MKKYLSSLFALLGVVTASYSQFLPQASPRKVQVAILFDTSNSMDGLIDQAKSRLWNIVNEMSSLRYQGKSPTLELALYDYGNAGLSETTKFIRQQLAFTSDLDLLSEKLFGLTTNGGQEYCGAVIQTSLENLSWSSNPKDLKMIFIAGNEPFNQGPINYKEACSLASSKNIFVNTIYCGTYENGVRELWNDCATLSKGEFFTINSDEKIQHIPTPYDASINQYNDSLNTTYFGYGTFGNDKKNNQLKQDKNAAEQSPSSQTERAIVKSKAAYSNESWDLIDAVEKNSKDISEISEEELPDIFKGKSTSEKKELIEAKRTEREKYQKKISELAMQREKFLVEERKKMNTSSKDDFGTSVNESIRKKAEALDFEKVILAN
jgi:hypothetical protein